jgi:hypothetical protein
MLRDAVQTADVCNILPDLFLHGGRDSGKIRVSQMQLCYIAIK